MKQIGSGLRRIEWWRDGWRHVTSKSIGHNPNTLGAQYLENSWRSNNRCCEAVRYYWATSILGSWPDYTIWTRATVIWQKAISLMVCKRNLVDIFYHIRQVTARVPKLVLWGVYSGSTFWGKGEVLGVSDGTIRKSDDVVSYRLSIVTVALSLTTRPQFAIECLGRSNQQVSLCSIIGEERINRCRA